MTQFVELLVGSFFVVTVSVVSWVIGLVMGFTLTRLAGGWKGRRSDVDELLAQQRAAQRKAGPTASGGVPGPTS